MTRIEPEPFGRKALRTLTPGGAKRRNDGIDLAVLRGGVDAAHTADRVGKDPARGDPEGSLDDVEALLEPARVMLFASHDLHILNRPWFTGEFLFQ